MLCSQIYQGRHGGLQKAFEHCLFCAPSLMSSDVHLHSFYVGKVLSSCICAHIQSFVHFSVLKSFTVCHQKSLKRSLADLDCISLQTKDLKTFVSNQIHDHVTEDFQDVSMPKSKILQYIQDYRFYYCFLSVNIQQCRARISFCRTRRLKLNQTLAQTQRRALQ